MTNGKMKIAIWHNLPSGGGKRAMYDQVRGLVSRGHTVESWCPQTANQTFLPLSELITEHVVPYDWKFEWRRGPINRRLQSYNIMKAQLAGIDRHSQECAREINQGGFDILLAHPCMLFRATPLPRYLTIPKVLYLQEPNRSMYEAMPNLPWVARAEHEPGVSKLRQINRLIWDLSELQALRIHAREEKDNVAAYDEILVNSSFSRESNLRVYGLDSKVCYLGVNTDFFVPTDAPKQRYVVGLGNIHFNKGIETALRAVGSIEAARRPDLVWIGNHAGEVYLKKMTQLAADLGVVFRPKILVADAELIQILGQAAVMIYTSYLEPFGYAPLEAGSCGTPVVAVAEGGVRESIQDGVNGVLVPDSDPEPLGAALLKFCDDLEHSRELGLQARRHVIDHWGLSVSIDRLEHRLQAVVESRTAKAV